MKISDEWVDEEQEGSRKWEGMYGSGFSSTNDSEKVP